MTKSRNFFFFKSFSDFSFFGTESCGTDVPRALVCPCMGCLEGRQSLSTLRAPELGCVISGIASVASWAHGV